MNTRDKIHLAALRGAVALVEHRAVKGKRRDLDCLAFMQGAFVVLDALDADSIQTAVIVGAIAKRGFREVRAQLHLLECAERETFPLTHGKMPDSV